MQELAKISKGNHETIKNSTLKKYLTVTYIEKQQEFSIKIQDRPNDSKLIALTNLPYSKNTDLYNVLNDVNKNILQSIKNLSKNNKNYKQDNFLEKEKEIINKLTKSADEFNSKYNEEKTELDKEIHTLQNELMSLERQDNEIKTEISHLEQQAQQSEQIQPSTSTVDNKINYVKNKKLNSKTNVKMIKKTKQKTDEQQQFLLNLEHFFLSLTKKVISNYLEQYQKSTVGYQKKNLRMVIQKFEENLQKNIEKSIQFLEEHKKNNFPNTQDKINILVENVYGYKKQSLLQLCHEMVIEIEKSKYSHAENAHIFLLNLNNTLKKYFKENIQFKPLPQHSVSIKDKQPLDVSELIKIHVMFLYKHPIDNNIQNFITINPMNLNTLINSISQLITYTTKPYTINGVNQSNLISCINILKDLESELKKVKVTNVLGNIYDTLCIEHIKTINKTNDIIEKSMPKEIAYNKNIHKKLICTKQANLLYTICTQFIISRKEKVTKNYKTISISKIFEITNKVINDKLSRLELSFLQLMKNNRDGKMSNEVYNKHIENSIDEIGGQCIDIINNHIQFNTFPNSIRSNVDNAPSNDGHNTDKMITNSLLIAINKIEKICQESSQEINNLLDPIPSFLNQYKSALVLKSYEGLNK